MERQFGLQSRTACRLQSACDEKIVLAGSGGQTHPVFGLWPLSLRGNLLRFLTDAKTLKVMAFAEASGYAVVNFRALTAGGRVIDPFFNVNTLDDLAVAETVCKEWGQ
jgi:molybdopterin-guanine dinucleotide biosynthesis protein A